MIKNILAKFVTYFHYEKVLDSLIYDKWQNNPLAKGILAPASYYQKIYNGVSRKTYPLIKSFEKSEGYAIDVEWFNNLAFHTQVVKKEVEINYQHGRVLYTLLREYIKKSKSKFVNILETGTARGFSSLCMAKALDDAKVFGRILTIDVLPHNSPIYWNCVDDAKGVRTRKKLLEKYNELTDKYITFLQAYSEIGLKRIETGRIYFAYLDGQHTFDAVLAEAEYVADRQKKGDVIVFDDYDREFFSGVVAAVDTFAKKRNYTRKLYRGEIDTSRFYVEAIKR